MTEYKTCFRCKAEKSLNDFGFNKTKKDGRAVYCKKCLCECNSNSRNKNKPIRINRNFNPVTRAEQKKRAKFKKFGITEKEYNQMLLVQNNCCAICFKSFIGLRVYIDHCHDKKYVRGLLCINCNVSLGHVKDNVEILKRMITYLDL